MNLPIAEWLHRIARGRQGASDLSQEEARVMLAALLREDADPMQLAALIIAERMKGESAQELAGFVQALRDTMPEKGHAVAARCVDLASYAGMRRVPMWHLVAAWRAAKAGKARVCVHGVHPIQGRVSAKEACTLLGIRSAGSVAEARAILAEEGIVYLDLSCCCPALVRLLELRARLGVRSFAHTAARLLNPLACESTLSGCFHPAYAERMASALSLLGQRCALVVQGVEGEPLVGLGRCKQAVWLEEGAWSFVRFPSPVADAPRIVQRKEALCSAIQRAAKGQLAPSERAVVERMEQLITALAEQRRPAFVQEAQ